MSKLKVTLTRSPIGRNETQRRTVRALGLRRLHQSVIHEPTPAVVGMIRQVKHLLSLEEV